MGARHENKQMDCVPISINQNAGTYRRTRHIVFRDRVVMLIRDKYLRLGGSRRAQEQRCDRERQYAQYKQRLRLGMFNVWFSHYALSVGGL